MPMIAYTALWNVTGHPAASVPAGFASDGLPTAVQLVGRAHDETTLLTLSAQLERARPWAAARPSLALLHSDIGWLSVTQGSPTTTRQR